MPLLLLLFLLTLTACRSTPAPIAPPINTGNERARELLNIPQQRTYDSLYLQAVVHQLAERYDSAHLVVQQAL
ncbi:MAG: hypothetical protein HUK09_06385, partial [Bacteroidaceae bacterium]|nr:hypothetical protein [Bacteroidaceae bacterium]